MKKWEKEHKGGAESRAGASLIGKLVLSGFDYICLYLCVKKCKIVPSGCERQRVDDRAASVSTTAPPGRSLEAP